MVGIWIWMIHGHGRDGRNGMDDMKEMTGITGPKIGFLRLRCGSCGTKPSSSVTSISATD